jgi:mannose-6-phosphate isomerase-like protein (cupin superfamily)
MLTTMPDDTNTTATLDNPVLGLHAIVRTTAEDSGGALWAAEVLARPGASGGPAHVHRRQEERFHLPEGTLSYRIGRRRGSLRAGETLVIPAGTAHEFRVEDREARFLAEFRPALRIGEFFEALFALALEGEVDDRGRPSPLRAATLMRDFPEEFFYLPHLPVPAQ